MTNTYCTHDFFSMLAEDTVVNLNGVSGASRESGRGGRDDIGHEGYSSSVQSWRCERRGWGTKPDDR